MMVPEPEPLECDRQQCNYLEYPLHRNELLGFFFIIIRHVLNSLTCLCKTPPSIYILHVVTRIIYRRASKQI